MNILGSGHRIEFVWGGEERLTDLLTTQKNGIFAIVRSPKEKECIRYIIGTKSVMFKSLPASKVFNLTVGLIRTLEKNI